VAAPIPEVPVPARIARAAPLRRSWRSRISTGHVVMIGAGLLAVVLTVRVLQSADSHVTVLRLRTDVAAGVEVRANNFETTTLHADADVLAELVAADRQTRLVGRLATRTLRAGELLSTGDLASPGSHVVLRSMSIPIASGHAVAGQLRIGDRVDVIATTDAGSQYAAVGTEVLGIDNGGGGGPLRSLSDNGSIQVAVTPDQAIAIANALKNGAIDLVRSTGAKAFTPPTAASPASSQTNDVKTTVPSTTRPAGKATTTTAGVSP
jgi:Flp pilus assembly protein CpaB